MNPSFSAPSHSPRKGSAPVELPADVAAQVVRLVGQFLRVTPPRSLPPAVRALRGFRPQALQKRRAAVLKALEDDDLRAGILEWLDDGGTPLSPEEADILRIAAERPDDWIDQLAGISTMAEPETAAHPESDPELAARLGRAEDRARKARAEARKAKEAARHESDALRSEVASLRALVAELESALEAARADADAARRSASDADADAARVMRRARRDTESARADADEARKRARTLEREGGRSREHVRALEEESESLRTALEAARRKVREPVEAPPKPRRRTPLPVPKGRLPEDPQTLYEWLSADGVRLLVDGYNVTKSEGGFGELSLEGQRERLIDEVSKLVARQRVATTIVFDGSEVGPGAGRRLRGQVRVEYSLPGEIADDHLVALLSTGTEATILVTSDRDLQGRAEALGATIASSTQLLELIR
jgi:predicted RNA-binding protein with PIN domain